MKIMKKRWQQFIDDFIGKKEYFLIDNTAYSFFSIIKDCVNKYVKGNVLDAGAGRLALKFLVSPKANNYFAVDKYVARDKISAVADLNLLPFKKNIFDTILCLQVIEHTPTPETVIKNLSSSLKKKGILILSAPHLSYLHGEPEDYYRFTKYGLIHMAEKNGLKVLEIRSAGSWLSFLFTPISDVLLLCTYKIPIVFQILFFLNSTIVRLISKVDLLFFENSIIPLNYVLVAEKVR